MNHQVFAATIRIRCIPIAIRSLPSSRRRSLRRSGSLRSTATTTTARAPVRTLFPARKRRRGLIELLPIGIKGVLLIEIHCVIVHTIRAVAERIETPIIIMRLLQICLTPNYNIPERIWR